MAKYVKTEEGYKEIEEVNSNKMDANNPVGTGSFSMGRKVGSVIGNSSHAEGYNTTASGEDSHAEGFATTASGKYQHVQGKFNIKDTNNKYSHIVGNGANINKCSNAHTLDWNGNAWFAGTVKVGGTGQDDIAAKTLATTEDIPTVDSTLTVAGAAADAAVVGNRINALSEDIATDTESKISAHNTGTDTHSDIRLLISGLTDRLNALADSDDTTLDQLSEVVAYIKANRELIASITRDKVSVADIVDNLTTNVSNKPLSAAQGVALKAMIDAISIPEKLPNPNALTFTGAVTVSYDGSAPVSVEIPSGGDAGKMVRHIATVSVTEGTTSYDVTVDSNGDTLNLESVYILTEKFWSNNGSYIQISINGKELTRAYGQSGSPQSLELEKMGELQKLTNIPKPSNVGISFGDYYNGKSAVTSVGFWSSASIVNTTIEIYGVDA